MGYKRERLRIGFGVDIHILILSLINSITFGFVLNQEHSVISYVKYELNTWHSGTQLLRRVMPANMCPLCIFSPLT